MTAKQILNIGKQFIKQIAKGNSGCHRADFAGVMVDGTGAAIITNGCLILRTNTETWQELPKAPAQLLPETIDKVITNAAVNIDGRVAVDIKKRDFLAVVKATAKAELVEIYGRLFYIPNIKLILKAAPCITLFLASNKFAPAYFYAPGFDGVIGECRGDAGDVIYKV